MVSRKSVYFYAAMFAAAAALTACAKGFTLEQLDKPKIAAAAAVAATTAATSEIPVATSPSNVSVLLELAAAQSPEVAAIVTNAGNRGVKSEISAGFAITELNLSGGLSGQGSVLYIAVKVTGADGKTAAAMIASNEANLAITELKDQSFNVEGYWSLKRPGQPDSQPYYVGLQSIATSNPADGTIRLKGSLLANLSGDAVVNLAPFDQDICAVLLDTSLLREMMPEATAFPGCPVGTALAPAAE